MQLLTIIILIGEDRLNIYSNIKFHFNIFTVIVFTYNNWSILMHLAISRLCPIEIIFV